MYIRVGRKWQFALEIFMIILGSFIMGFAFSIFLEPNNISTGGFSGIAMIINSLLNKVGVAFLSSSLIYLILNIGLFAYAFRAMGKKFAFKALVGIVAFSVAMEVFTFISGYFVYDNIISSIFGGACMGIGLGLVVRFGGSTGGSDMIACLLKKKNSNFSIGKIVIIIDIIVIIFSIFVFNNGLALLPYTILALIMYSITTDFVNEGYRQVRAYSIITTKPEEVAEQITHQLARGCTLSNVKGMYNHEDKSCLVCLVSKFQSSELKNIIKEIDSHAFVYSMSVSEVMGEWADNSTINENKKNNKEKNKNSKDN